MTAESPIADELRQAADDAMRRMRDAALEARALHAEAELMRHLLGTAAKVKDRPEDEAVRTIVDEWLAAWHLPRSDWPALARDLDAVTVAFHRHARAGDAASAEALRQAWGALKASFRREGMDLADQMAWRSQCAHGWWELVVPVPADLPGRKPRPTVPRVVEGQPFWNAGCADFCR